MADVDEIDTLSDDLIEDFSAAIDDRVTEPSVETAFAIFCAAATVLAETYKELGPEAQKIALNSLLTSMGVK